MSKFLKLTKVLFKSGGSSLVKDGKKKFPKTIALVVLMIFAFLPMIAAFAGLTAKGYDFLAGIGQQGLILSFDISVTSMVIFVFGILYVMATFYFAMDIDNLLPLPLKSSMIYSAKFAIVLTYEYLTEIIFSVPVLITYGIKSGAGLVYYIYALAVFLVLPIIPLVMAAIINMIIMRFTNVSKNKDKFKIISGLFILVLALTFNVLMQKFTAGTGNSEQMAQLFMQGNNSLVDTVSKIFPTSILGVNSLLYSSAAKGIVNLLLLIAISFGILAILVTLSEVLYFKAVVGISQAASKRRNLTSKELEEKTVESSSFKSYLIKELKLLFRTPAYFMNCVIMNFLWPVFLLIPAVTQPKAFKNLDMVRVYFENDKTLGIILAGAFGVAAFIGVASPTASTAISREGKNLFFAKFIPMNYQKQIMAKIFSAIILSFSGLIVIIAIAAAVLKPPAYLAALILVVSMIAVFFTAFIGILVDLNFPKLEWDVEERAVKQNMNSIIAMLICAAIAALTIYIIIKAGLNMWATFGIIVGGFGIIDVILFNIVCTYGVKLLKNIDA